MEHVINSSLGDDSGPKQRDHIRRERPNRHQRMPAVKRPSNGACHTCLVSRWIPQFPEQVARLAHNRCLIRPRFREYAAVCRVAVISGGLWRQTGMFFRGAIRWDDMNSGKRSSTITSFLVFRPGGYQRWAGCAVALQARTWVVCRLSPPVVSYDHLLW